MILLNPIWLFALAALSIPVAIHLWNIRQGKTLKVGSISLINVSSQKSSRSLKLHDLLLLLLRCLWLTLLAFVLTQPLWQRHINLSQIKGWVLIPKEDLKETYQKFKTKIDSLTKAGYEFHYFNKGFEKDDLSKLLTDAKVLKPADAAQYWSLIRQLNEEVSFSLPVYLFTSNRVTHFTGKKPEVALNLHWQTYTSADSISNWVSKAWLTGNNDIQVVQGNSKPSGTYYSNYTISSGDQQTPFMVRTENGRLSVGLKNSEQVINVDTSTWSFAIYAEKNSPDVGYVKAALRSVAQFTNHKAIIKQFDDAGQIPKHSSWLFWLSLKPVNTGLNPENLFRYENGKARNIDSWLKDQGGPLSQEKITLYKSIIAGRDNGYVLWQDGFGNTILNVDRQQQINIYHFYSRFDPAWGDLVWSDKFPEMLLRLIVGQQPEPDGKYDRRVLDAKQLMPVINKSTVATGKVIERSDLSRYVWLLLVLVFVVERWLAHKKSPKQILQNG